MGSAVNLKRVLALPTNRGLGLDVAERLRGSILTGNFGPGERLPEAQLAQALGVSRAPVREALATLEREGLIVIRRNRGAFVAQLSREDLDEVYSLRVAIERLAVERCVANASDADLAELQGVVDRIAELMERGITEQEAAELDLEFHDIVYRSGKHRRLYETWATLRPQIHVLLLNRNVAHEDFRDLVISSHQEIVDAIRARDVEHTVQITMNHLLGSYERVRQSHISRFGEDGRTGQVPPNGATNDQRTV